jgi:endonuclease/exonuclease/phosphatase family metal-dependent hydrolase
VSAVAAAIAASQANIFALQEIEGDQTLAAITTELKQKHNLSYRYAFIQGTDRFTEQDVGILYTNGLTQYRRHEQTREMFTSNKFYNLSKHLVAEFHWKTIASPLTLMTVHLRATESAEDFRIRQSRLAMHWLEPQLAQKQDVILLGDINSERPVGDRTGDMQELLGDGLAHPLVDVLAQAAPTQRRTHLILDRAYDRILVSPSMMEDGPGLDWVFKKIEVRGDLCIRGQADGPEHWDQRLTLPPAEFDSSDHFPVIATFELK